MPTRAAAKPKPPFPKQHQAKPGREAALLPRPRYGAPAYQGAQKLAGQVALITGGDSGIGRAVAVLFAREGAAVAFTHLPEEVEDAEETRGAIEVEGTTALALEGDVRDPAGCGRVVQRTLRRLGRLDIPVNNAAFQQHRDSLEDVTDESGTAPSRPTSTATSA